MTKRGEYIGVIEEGSAMLLHPRPGQGPIAATVCAAVKFTGDGRIVRRGTRYIKGEEPRNIKATASRMTGPWNSYLKRTGKRFELEQDKKDAKKAAKRKAAQALLNRQRTNAPKLAELLDRIVNHYDFRELLERESTGQRLCDFAREARELLDVIATEPPAK